MSQLLTAQNTIDALRRELDKRQQADVARGQKAIKDRATVKRICGFEYVDDVEALAAVILRQRELDEAHKERIQELERERWELRQMLHEAEAQTCDDEGEVLDLKQQLKEARQELRQAQKEVEILEGEQDHERKLKMAFLKQLKQEREDHDVTKKRLASANKARDVVTEQLRAEMKDHDATKKSADVYLKNHMAAEDALTRALDAQKPAS